MPAGNTWSEIAKDPELEPLHGSPAWEALLEENLPCEPPDDGAAS